MQMDGTKASSPPQFVVLVSEQLSDIGGQAVQQDSGLHFTVFDQHGHKCEIVIICDGHGPNGKNISQMVTTTFYNEMSSSGFYDRFKQNPSNIAESMFSVAQENVFRYMVECLDRGDNAYEIKDGHIYSASEILRGGTTATIVMVDDQGCVFTMNVADSEAWIIQGDDALKLTADHLPDTLSEFERIRECSPTTTHLYDRRYYMTAHARGDDIFPITEQRGYYVKNVNEDWATVLVEPTTSQKLAFTRSIGDENMRKGGVIATPSVYARTVTESAVIKVASDGFWDNIKTSTLVSKTREDAENKMGMDMGQHWFERIKKENYKNFKHGRDNMMGYLITIQRI